MSANSSPIFSRTPDVQWAIGVIAANTTTDLTTGTTYLVFTADPAEGGRLEKIIARALGTNVATVLRIWINNGSSPAVAANNTLAHEVTLAATTLSQVAALVAHDIALGWALPPGYRVYVTLGTAVAAGYDVTAMGGKY